MPIENKILIEYTSTRGDGTPPQFLYLGVAMPHFVLYVDGRLLMRVDESLDNNRSVYYQEAMLPASEMCLLLDSVENTGFLDVVGGTGDSIYAWEDPIYDFGEFENFSEGAPFDLIILNGPEPKFTQIYSQYWDFVAPEMVAMRELLDQFSAKDTQPFEPQQVMLWIEEGVPSWFDLELVPQTWPEELPALSDLVKQPYSDAVIAEGSDALWESLDYRLKYTLFVESGKEYLVVVRPILPHETPDEFPKLSWDAQELPLPFECVP